MSRWTAAPAKVGIMLMGKRNKQTAKKNLNYSNISNIFPPWVRPRRLIMYLTKILFMFMFIWEAWHQNKFRTHKDKIRLEWEVTKFCLERWFCIGRASQAGSHRYAVFSNFNFKTIFGKPQNAKKRNLVIFGDAPKLDLVCSFDLTCLSFVVGE